MSFKRYDADDFVVSSDAITSTLWSTGNPILTEFFTSSVQAAGSSGNFYLSVYQTSSLLNNSIAQFEIAYADISGGGLDMPFSKTAGPKKAAQYKALNSGKADFIAKPSYTIKKTTYLLGLMSIVDAEVSGYGGVYKNFKQVDMLELNIENAVNKKLVEKLNLNK